MGELADSSVPVVHRMAGLDTRPLVVDIAAAVVHRTLVAVVGHLHMVAEEDNLAEVDSLVEEGSPAEGDNPAEEDIVVEELVRRRAVVLRGIAVQEVAHNPHMAAGREEHRRQVVAEDTGWAAHHMLAVEEDSLLLVEDMAVARMVVAGNLYSSAGCV